MENKIQNSLNKSIDIYRDYIIKHTGGFDYGAEVRQKQAETLKVVFDSFSFNDIKLIETGVSGNLSYGLFGLILAGLVNEFNGEMSSVDLNYRSCENSKKIFKEVYPNIIYTTICDDSLNFLKTPPFIPNILHLDSYDFDLLNPFPSALHAWKEFKTIENKMEKGSIIIIDDNWVKNTRLQWIVGQESMYKDIDYPIVGKGANIYNEVINGLTSWELVGNHYNTYDNIKVILRKK